MPYKANEARRHKITRARHKVANWPEYDRALQKRWSLTVWVTPRRLRLGSRAHRPAGLLPQRFCQLSRLSGQAGRWAADRLGGLYDAERSSGGFGEAETAGEGGNGLVVTATATKQITEFAMLSAEAPG